MPRGSATQREKDRRIISRGSPPCAICGLPIDYTLKWPDPHCFVVDHIIPIIRDGPDTLSNKQPAHARCNNKKKARIIPKTVKTSGTLRRPTD